MTQAEEQAHQQAVLFLAALLAPRRELDYRARSAAVAHAQCLALNSLEATVESLRIVFRSAGIPHVPSACLRSPAIEKARTLAVQWERLGIRTVGQQELEAPRASFRDVPLLWFAYGKRELLSQPAVAVLNSRKSRHLSPRDLWIATTKDLVRYALHEGFAVVSSYGTPAYAVVSALVKGSPLIAVCDNVLPFMDSADARHRFLSQYEDLFDQGNTVFVSGFAPGSMPDRAERYVQRDHHVAALSSMLVVADVRPGGNMASVLSIAEQRGIPVRRVPLTGDRLPEDSLAELTSATNDVRESGRSQTITTAHRSEFSAKSLKRSPFRPPLPTAGQLAGNDAYLIHYTRSCAGPWPGQTVAAYYRTLIEASPGAEHTGFDTLVRILEQGTIRASHKLTRGTTEVVCFTELFPEQLQSLNQWRPGLLRWSFEPYAIAVRKDRLFGLGGRPVIYATEDLFQDLSDDLVYLFQLHGSSGKTWSAEKEWRIRGDLVLSCFAPKEMFVIVPTVDEATLISERFNVRAGLAYD